MSDMSVIREIEKKIEVPFPELSLEALEKAPGEPIRGYTGNPFPPTRFIERIRQIGRFL